MSRSLCVMLILMNLLTVRVSVADDSQVSTTGGIVKGRVVYEPDKSRPWRYQRYYVKKSGELAEAVVALRGRELREVPDVEPRKNPTIDQYNFRFEPETTAIRAGQSVRFTNSDSTTHNVRSAASIATFNVNLGAEDEYTHRFERAGGLRSPVTLGCVYHGGMRAWIYVMDHPFFTVTKPDGAFEFSGVPPGEYALEMVHPAGQLRWKQPVAVMADGTVEVEIHVSPNEKTLKY